VCPPPNRVSADAQRGMTHAADEKAGQMPGLFVKIDLQDPQYFPVTAIQRWSGPSKPIF
jgi:hypothetical protein